MADLNVIGIVGGTASQALTLVQGNWLWLLVGIALIIVTVLLFFFIKKIIVNSVLGLALFLIIKYVFVVELPFIPALVISIIFGPAGIGVMLLLKFFGLL